MLVEHTTRLPEGGGWCFEYSWAGDRIFAIKDGSSVRLTSILHRRELTNRFASVAAAVAKLPVRVAVLDGVIRLVDPGQRPLFRESRGGDTSPPMAAIRFIATDLLWLDAIDVRQLPFQTRREQLVATIEGTGILVPHLLEGPPAQLLASAREVGSDGVFARKCESRYRPYARSGDWLRVASAGSEQPGPQHPSAASPTRNDSAGSSFGSAWRPALG